MLFSDLFPTIAALAGVDAHKVAGLGLGGFDMTSALQTANLTAGSPRRSVLLEMYYGTEGGFLFPDEDVVAYHRCRNIPSVSPCLPYMDLVELTPTHHVHFFSVFAFSFSCAY